MKKTLYILPLFVLLFVSESLNAQCKVLVKELSGKYEGDCKKGLAHGNGKAQGIDYYEGEFKKGYPSGMGAYTWHDGSTFTGEFYKGKMDGKGVLISNVEGTEVKKEGYWKYGYYAGDNKNVKIYKVKEKKYVTNYSIKRKGDGNSVSIKWVKGARILYSMSGLTMTATSGIEGLEMNFCGFNQIEFPFSCMMQFVNTDKAETMTYDCIFNFELLIPGEYEIIFKD